MTPEEGYAEALRRIDEAKQTGATKLDLTSLQLRFIPVALQSCVELQELNLWGNQISQIENLPAGLLTSNLGENQISQIENLPAGLQSLNLWSSQISQIENLPAGLQALDLWNNLMGAFQSCATAFFSYLGEVLFSDFNHDTSRISCPSYCSL